MREWKIDRFVFYLLYIRPTLIATQKLCNLMQNAWSGRGGKRESGKTEEVELTPPLEGSGMRGSKGKVLRIWQKATRQLTRNAN